VLPDPGLPEHDKQAAEAIRGLLRMAQIAGRLAPVACQRRLVAADLWRLRTVAGARDRFEHAWNGLRPLLHPEGTNHA
jgi:hypothetical protein